MKNYTYLLIDLGCFLVPFIASFYPKHSFAKEWKAFFTSNILMALFFIAWDMIFTEWGVWGFNTTYLTGYNIGNLPIEEILFFICIPYACVFTYFSMQYLLKLDPLKKFNDILYHSFLCVSILLMIFGVNRLYSFSTGLFTFIFLIIVRGLKVNLNLVYFSYFLILPFFFISNGILTGSFLNQPIVWYNDAENLGLRVGTIPIEDSIYGFLMIAMNIVLFEYFRKKNNY